MPDGKQRTTGVITRTAEYVSRLADAWFGPGIPQQPAAPAGTPPRQWDYPAGWNLRTVPRAGEELSFDQLRAVAKRCELVRLAIETVKNQCERVGWNIRQIESVGVRPRGEKERKDKRIQELEAFFAYPDRVTPFKPWLRMFLEDTLVIDAASVSIQRSRGGKPYAIELIDGATIVPKMDETGRVERDGIAYQQVIKGAVAGEWTRADFIYAVRNPRTNSFYGFSETEQLVTTINIELRKMIRELAEFTEGTTPEAFMGMPDNWSTAQIEEFQRYWDGVMEGNTALRRRIRFLPGQMAKNYIPTKEPVLKDEHNEWLARKILYAFSLPPTAFVKQGMNRATGQIMQDSAIDEGLVPRLAWVKSVLDRIIQEGFGYTDLGFFFEELRAPDSFKKAQTDDLYVRMGAKSIDQVAEENGWDPPGMGPAVYTATGPVLVKDIVNPKPDPALVAPPGTPPPGTDPGVDPNGKGPDGKPTPDGTPGGDRRRRGPLPAARDEADGKKLAAAARIYDLRQRRYAY